MGRAEADALRHAMVQKERDLVVIRDTKLKEAEANRKEQKGAVESAHKQRVGELGAWYKDEVQMSYENEGEQLADLTAKEKIATRHEIAQERKQLRVERDQKRRDLETDRASQVKEIEDGHKVVILDIKASYEEDLSAIVSDYKALIDQALGK